MRNAYTDMGFKHDGHQFSFVKYGKTTLVEFNRNGTTVRTRTAEGKVTGATFTKSVPDAAIIAYVREVV